MISDFREGGDRFTKVRESLYKKAFIIGGKSEMGGGGVKNDPKIRISFMDNPYHIGLNTTSGFNFKDNF